MNIIESYYNIHHNTFVFQALIQEITQNSIQVSMKKAPDKKPAYFFMLFFLLDQPSSEENLAKEPCARTEC